MHNDGPDDAPDTDEDGGVHNDGHDDAVGHTEDGGVHNDGADDAPDVGEDGGVHNDGADDAPDMDEDGGVHNDGADDAPDGRGSRRAQRRHRRRLSLPGARRPRPGHPAAATLARGDAGLLRGGVGRRCPRIPSPGRGRAAARCCSPRCGRASGCSTWAAARGASSPRCSAAGAEAIGVELAEAALERARRVAPGADLRRVAPDGSLPLEHGEVDLVWCSEVLEHVVDTTGFLTEVRRVLRPGGRLLLTVPDHGRLKRTLLALARHEAHYDPQGQHLRFYTRRSLTHASRPRVRRASGSRRSAACRCSARRSSPARCGLTVERPPLDTHRIRVCRAANGQSPPQGAHMSLVTILIIVLVVIVVLAVVGRGRF